MKLQTVINRLRAKKAQLHALGVKSLSVFGSTARGDARDDSDVDLAAVIEKRPFSLADLVRLEQQLQDILGVDVDVVTEPARKPYIQQKIDEDRVSAF